MAKSREFTQTENAIGVGFVLLGFIVPSALSYTYTPEVVESTNRLWDALIIGSTTTSVGSLCAYVADKVQYLNDKIAEKTTSPVKRNLRALGVGLVGGLTAFLTTTEIVKKINEDQPHHSVPIRHAQIQENKTLFKTQPQKAEDTDFTFTPKSVQFALAG